MTKTFNVVVRWDATEENALHILRLLQDRMPDTSFALEPAQFCARFRQDADTRREAERLAIDALDRVVAEVNPPREDCKTA
jgi:hypothetical protein